MNKYQRIILVVGAGFFILVLLTSPRIKKMGIINKEGLASIIDVSTASIRGIAVLGATIMLYFATREIKPKKEE